MSERWEKDSKHGITRQIVDEYMPSDRMPGATVIPSAKPGDLGGQLGQDPEEPIVQILDPDMPDGGQVIDTKQYRDRKKSAQVEVPQNFPDRNEAYKDLIAHGTPSKDQPMEPQSQQPYIEPPQPMDYSQTSDPHPDVVELSQTAPAPYVEISPPEQAPPVVAEIPPPAPPAPAAPQQPEYVQQGAPSPVVPPAPAPAPETAPPAAPVATAPASPPQPPQVEAPSLEVQFETPDGAKVVAYFHAMIRQQDKTTLVFAYDTRFKFGTRYTPPLSQAEKPMRITIPQHTQTIYAFSPGMDFRFGNWEFLILIIDEARTYGQNRGA